MRHRSAFVALLVLGASLALPGIALAQSAIAGVVRDSSGAVLPGVTVEASSPALIEKTKSTTSNEAGQYRIVDLRPGVYTVSFKLPGFNTVVRENIELEANFTAPINVDMRIGSLEESITVTGESPVVDVQTSGRREVVSEELIESLPTGRNFQLLAGTVPAVSTGVFDVGGSSTMWTGGSLLTHGSQTRDSRTLIDGMVADAMFGGGQCSCIYDNEAQTQEVAVQVSGGSAENQTGGVLVNRIPKTGGNQFRGEFVGLFSNGDLQADNIDEELNARGIRIGDELYRLYDVNYSLGGPIMRDRLWFFVSGRNNAYNNYVANAFNPDGTPRRRRQHRQIVPGPYHGAGHEERQVHSTVRLGQQGSRSPWSVRNGLAGSLRSADAAGVPHRPGQVDADAEQQAAARSRIHQHLHRVAVQVPAGHSARDMPVGVRRMPCRHGLRQHRQAGSDPRHARGAHRCRRPWLPLRRISRARHTCWSRRCRTCRVRTTSRSGSRIAPDG